jgi:GNAT superfamily N-acetyltransferase
LNIFAFEYMQKLAAARDISRQLLLEAEADPQIQGYVYPDDTARTRVPIVAADRTVGFFTPRKDGSVWRTGAIYVQPSYRGQGLATAAIAEFMRDKKGTAFIEDSNAASRAAFVRAGFVKGKRDEKEAGNWYDHHPVESVAKTAADQSLEHLRGLLSKFKKDADKAGYNYFVVAHGDDPAVGAETSRVQGQPDSVIREHKKLHSDFSKSIGTEHVNWGRKTTSK